MASTKAVQIALALAFALLPASTALAGSTTSDASGYGVDPCYKQCRGLLTAVHPRSEAKRVFHNCMSLCQGHGTIICPGGATAIVGKSTCQ